MLIFRFATLLFFALLGYNQPIYAQQTIPQDSLQRVPRTDRGEVYTVVEKQPEFPGGQRALYKYIEQHLSYPDVARKAGISGKVFVAFIINTDGSLQDVEILKGIGYGCDEQAARLVQGMPKWIPGSQSGRAIRVKYNLPITFSLK